jgi:type I restriction-modification system DNA methylase subunit
MNPVELQSQVLNVLENFSGVGPMKKLFWTLLNYDQVNKPTSRRGWPDAASSVLQEDPLVLASGGEKNDFHVVYSRLAKDRLSLADERIVTTRLLKDHPYGLFLFSDRSQTNWHFLNVQIAGDVEKRKLYRRVTVGPNEKMRTACQVLSQLDLASINPTLFGLSPLVIQGRHDQAFDVEVVTEEFYRTYHSIFDTVQGLIKGFRNDERKHLFTQRLFNRLMFIAFIQKKGWLQFDGKKHQDYLNALWKDYKKNGNKEMGFYYERLYNLFFNGLGADSDQNIIGINRGGVWAKFIGQVPYLNGGLFEEDDDDKNSTIKVPDEALKTILHDLFDHFNFTVTEATPLDVEVAVDPEMLGKVFEELVTGRHETGSYYTPKAIVSFMCREALKGYLESNLSKEKPDSIASFVDEHEPGGLRDAETVLEVLRRVRCCDPACGSGAYLLGMLHELMDLRSCLFKTKQVDSLSSYDRKLEILQRSLYGVDIDPFAVNIARLRLWLSLAVEFEGERPEPLPNLKFEIEEGDSVSAPGPQPSQGLMRDAVVQEFARKKALYIKAHGENKKQLEEQVLELKSSIKTWTHGDDAVSGFDWPIEFADVFHEGGFDIVVANPPYVRQELIKDLKPTLKKVFPEVYTGVGDLYVYFYARGLQILKPDGMLAFISSNKWFRAAYGEKLRRHVAASSHVRNVIDFGELPVFKAAATFPMIFVCRKGTANSAPVMFAQVKSLEAPYPDMGLLFKQIGSSLPPEAISGADWNFASGRSAIVTKTMETNGTPLAEYVRNEIYYGVKTGFNDAFIIDTPTKRRLISEDPSSAAVIKRLVVGDDVRRWNIRDKGRWLIYSPWDLDIKRYPAIHGYLRQFKTQLEARPECKDGRYKWWCMARYGADYKDAFEKPKIVYPVIGKEPRFAFDEKRSYTNDKVFLIPRTDLFLLGVLNSAAVWHFLKQTCSSLGDADEGGRLELRSIYVSKIPVPKATDSQKRKISQLVEKCIEHQGEGCESLEATVDELVCELYGVDITDLDTSYRATTA